MDHHPVKVIRGFPPVATRRRTRLEGVLAVLGEIRACGPVWDVESGGTICVLVADCQRPQSRAGLKPETMTATFEEFSPAHDFFDYTGSAKENSMHSSFSFPWNREPWNLQLQTQKADRFRSAPLENLVAPVNSLLPWAF
jgi:hypothetical protein